MTRVPRFKQKSPQGKENGLASRATTRRDNNTGPTCPSADLITSGAWQGRHWSANVKSLVTRPGNMPTAQAGIEPGSAAFEADALTTRPTRRLLGFRSHRQTADRLAKAAAKLPQPHLSTSYKEVKTLLKKTQKSAWGPKNKKQKTKKNNGYDPQKDQISTLDRRTQTTIFRLRTGHCVLRKHLKRLGLADSAHCECGSEEQTPGTFFRPAHTWRQYANSFGQKTLKWAPSSGGKMPNYSGRRTS